MKNISDIYKSCTLCPRECKVDRTNGRVGYCGAGDKIRIARASLHHWEEPCISGDSGSGAVFFSHCTLRCVYCQNYEISHGGKGYVISASELADEFLRLEDRGASNINLVTPTHFLPGIIKAIEIAKSHGLSLPFVYNTGGYEKSDTIKMLDGYVDVYLPDMKYYKDKYSVSFSSAQNYFTVASQAIKEMHKQRGRCKFDKNGLIKSGVIVRHLMLPGLMFESKKIVDYIYDEYGDDVWLSLMSQYTPNERVKNTEKLSEKVNNKTYEALINYCMDKGMTNVYIQDSSSADSSYIPEFYDKKI